MAKGYWIAHVDVRDPEGYKGYVAGAKLAFDKYGARMLARGGAGHPGGDGEGLNDITGGEDGERILDRACRCA